MNIHLILLLLSMPILAGAAEPAASVFNLVGAWQANIEFGKDKIGLLLKLQKSPEGKVTATIAIPEQGAREIPVSAMLFNYPAVRWEIDPFNTAFNGTINESATEIAGIFEEGPGGRPMPVVFRRNDKAGLEQKRVYTFAAGESRDFRGYWEGMAGTGRGEESRIGLKIGRGEDGSFEVLMDVLDRGRLDMVASSVQISNNTYKVEWRLSDNNFEGRLDPEGNQLTGKWRQRGSLSDVTFKRLDQAATVLPSNASFTPDRTHPDDIRGDWKGVLDIPENKLRIILKLGQTPDGLLVGTLSSPDQGGGAIPMSSGGLTNTLVRLEWKAIRGVFKGTLNPDGSVLDGDWEQMGPPLKLRLERDSNPEGAEKR